MNLTTIRTLFLTAGLGMLLSIPARADLLGAAVSWQYYYNGGAWFCAACNTDGSFVDNGGVGGTFAGQSPAGTGPMFNIDANASSIAFDYSVLHIAPGFWYQWNSSPLSLAPTIHNGIALNFSGVSLESVTVDAATNLVGFSASDIRFTSNEIQVDWSNLFFNSATVVKLDVITTPEPSVFGVLSALIAVLVLVQIWKPADRMTIRKAACLRRAVRRVRLLMICYCLRCRHAWVKRIEGRPKLMLRPRSTPYEINSLHC